MLVRKSGGRKYSDPDVVAIIDDSGGLLDPRSLIRHQVNSLLGQLEDFEGAPEHALGRITILASLAGFDVKPMDAVQQAHEKQEAVLMYTCGNGKKGTIFFNPNKPRARTVFSIAHEITHSFFPTSRTGARFRSLCKEGSKEGRELEVLCDFGASELTMPRARFRLSVERWGFGIASIDQIAREFGASFEATLYRVAATANFAAAAGRACFRLRKSESVETSTDRTRSLFASAALAPEETPVRRYRRQSFHRSSSFPAELAIPWNKSFPQASCIYRAAQTGKIEGGAEIVPLGKPGKQLHCQIEAMPSPFQPTDADQEWPDILFLLRACGSLPKRSG